MRAATTAWGPLAVVTGFIAGLVLSIPASAVVYEVGPGQPLAAIGEVPWESLEPGDVVRIHWRPDPYREKWVINRSGAPGSPILVQGVPGANRELPVVSGEDAVTRLELDYWNEDRSVVKVGGASIPGTEMPSWIVIENLHVRLARPPYTFTDDRGNVGTYADNAAAIHIERGEHITIRNCWLIGSGNGLFVSSSDSHVSRDILIEGCYIAENGMGGSIYHHNSYTAALGITFQYNEYGMLAPGALGNNLKDRSAGLVVRYNYILGGNRQLDLVDAEDSLALRGDPRYNETHVYGNVLVELPDDGNRQVAHYGGDSANTDAYRKGMLYFYNNTIVSHRTDRTTLLRLSTNEERCDARNNLVYASRADGDTISLLAEHGALEWSHNWIEPGWRISFGTFDGTVNDDGTSVEGTDPVFLNEWGGNYHLADGSPCVDAGTPLHPAVLPDHEPVRQYVQSRHHEPRPDCGPLDIGAFELLPPVPRPVTGLRFDPARSRLSWDDQAGDLRYDVVKGNVLALATGGFQSAVLGCIAEDIASAEAWDAPDPPPSGIYFYLARASSCGVDGSYDSDGGAQAGPRDPGVAGSSDPCR